METPDADGFNELCPIRGQIRENRTTAEWLPIAEAIPNVFLVICEEGHADCITVAQKNGVLWYEDTNMDLSWTPTHFMHLPPVPGT